MQGQRSDVLAALGSCAELHLLWGRVVRACELHLKDGCEREVVGRIPYCASQFNQLASRNLFIFVQMTVRTCETYVHGWGGPFIVVEIRNNFMFRTFFVHCRN